MKINRASLSSLVHVRERMGALLGRENVITPATDGSIDWPSGIHTISIDNASNIDRGPEGEILVSGKRAIIYIQDTGHSRAFLLSTPERSKKYHLFHCHTIEHMLASGRFERYVRTIRCDGSFLVHTREMDGRNEEIEAALLPCANCLMMGKIYSEPSKFDLAKYLDVNNDFEWHGRLPSTSDDDGRSSGYAKDWSEHSKRVREKAGYQCEDCGVNMINHKRLLHTHHRSGVKSSTDPNDLVALCAICHAEQPQHGHMRVSKNDRKLILDLRSSTAAHVSSGSM